MGGPLTALTRRNKVSCDYNDEGKLAKAAMKRSVWGFVAPALAAIGQFKSA
jgi:hypothetical protein